VKYSDLRAIEFKWYDLKGSIDTLKNEHELNAPDSVMQQFYIDHSDKDKFISLYGELELHRLKWILKSVPTNELISIGNAATHPEFMHERALDASYFSEWGYAVISRNAEIAAHWKKHGTWLIPPIFINGALLNPQSNSLHLAEGHSRLGCLMGLAKHNIIDLSPEHHIYYGDYAE